jgi:hypothetical protein
MKNYISEILTGSVGLIGVLLGSLLTYKISSMQIKHEENRKILRNIYFRIFTELRYCFLTENAFRKEHDVAKKVSIIDLKQHLEEILENNIDIIDNQLFRLYHTLKSEQYFDDLSGGAGNYKYLALFSILIKNMYQIQKKEKLIDKYFKRDLRTLYYQYAIWFILMDKIQDWKKVEDILNKRFHFKRSFKAIYYGIFLKKLKYNREISIDEFIDLFVKYCRYEIIFPFNKIYWQK